MMPAMPALEPLVRQRTVLLTTYRRDGAPVGTPVHVALDGDLAFVRTWDTTWKLKRTRNNPEVEITPSTFRGRTTGPAVRARARILKGEESVDAGRRLARKYPLLHGALIPLLQRLRGSETMHVELTPTTEVDVT